MTAIVWDATGEKFFETGVDRGVLYYNGVGVPWNGLISVGETNTGEPREFFVDGYKYLQISSTETFSATITAFSSPNEFLPCAGIVPVRPGVYFTNQIHRPFDFSYRTRIGNDVRGVTFGYKIHLVYNALASPISITHTTIGAEVTPVQYSWNVMTKPPEMAGHFPSSHVLLDSRMIVPSTLARINDILYGSSAGDARLPTLDELVDIFDEAA
jgi:hypothetical protein